MAVKPIPDGYHTVTPYLIVHEGAKAIDFYKKAFGATELMRFPGPEGKLMHAELKIGDSPIMLADECPEMGAVSAKTVGGTPVRILLYVNSVDTLFKQAVAAGAKVERPVQDQFYGDRSGSVIDPFGHKWTLSTHIEDVSVDETNRRAEVYKKEQGGPQKPTKAKK